MGKCDGPDILKKIEDNTFLWYNRESDEIMAEYLRQWKKKYRGKNERKRKNT